MATGFLLLQLRTRRAMASEASLSLASCWSSPACAAWSRQWAMCSSSSARATLCSAREAAATWVRMSMQYLSSSTMRAMPRTWPSIRRSRMSRARVCWSVVILIASRDPRGHRRAAGAHGVCGLGSHRGGVSGRVCAERLRAVGGAEVVDLALMLGAVGGGCRVDAHPAHGVGDLVRTVGHGVLRSLLVVVSGLDHRVGGGGVGDLGDGPRGEGAQPVGVEIGRAHV